MNKFSPKKFLKGCTRKNSRAVNQPGKKFLQAKNPDLEMWHAAENVWVARVGDKSFKKSPNSLLFQFSNTSLIYQIILSIRLGKKKTFSLRGGGGPQIGEVTCGRSLHLSCRRDQIKMTDYMDRWVTPPKRFTSPSWGPPPPCKQALNPNIV